MPNSYLLYDFDMGELVTTTVYDEYGEAAIDAARLDNVMIVAVPSESFARGSVAQDETPQTPQTPDIETGPYYYIVVAYYSHDMLLGETSDLYGPFETPEVRERHIRKQIEKHWDLEEDVYNVTLLELRDGLLVATESGYVGGDILPDTNPS